MSRNGLILTSLVGAIPGALMMILMVMAFVNYAGGQSVIHKILCAMLLLIGLLLAAMPVGIFVLTGPKAEKAPAKKKDEEGAEVVEEASGEVVEAASGDELLAEDAESPSGTDPNLEVEEGPPDEFAVTGEVVTDESDAEAAEDFGAEEEVLEVEEDEAPKKGKKK